MVLEGYICNRIVMMPGFDELEIYYQLKTNMSTVDEANPAVWEKRLSEIRQL